MHRPNITVLGGGSWGSAVASIAARNAPTLIWARDQQSVADINERHVNSRYRVYSS